MGIGRLKSLKTNKYVRKRESIGPLCSGMVIKKKESSNKKISNQLTLIPLCIFTINKKGNA